MTKRIKGEYVIDTYRFKGGIAAIMALAALFDASFYAGAWPGPCYLYFHNELSDEDTLIFNQLVEEAYQVKEIKK